MKRHATAFLQLIAASCALQATLAFAVPPLLLPHDGPIPKGALPRPFESEGHRVQLNLDELKGLRHGDEVELRLPNGAVHTLVQDLLKDEGNGITSWIGYLKGSPTKLRAIVTTGPGGSFGRISTPEGDFQIVPGEGFDWLIDMEAEAPHLPPIDLHDDVRTPSIPKATYPQMFDPEYQPTLAGVNSVAVSKSTPAQVVVDLMVVHTTGLAANLGATLQTRLNFLVASANTMYADSEVGIVLRLVHSVAVDYSDTIDNGTALMAITPSGGGGTGAFAGIETLRSQYGADLVTFLRDGGDLWGYGVSWVPNGAMSAAWAPYMYSVITGCVRGCEWVFVHELGHNMGNMHDRATSSWQAGGVANPPQGSYPYSFGHYSCNANLLSCNPTIPGSCTSQPECGSPAVGTNNFSDIMAYFHATTTRNFKFSNPYISCTGDLGIQQACGVVEGQPNAANAALSMNNNRVALSALRAATATTPPPTTGSARLADISTRMQVSVGNDVMISGFVIRGSSPKTVVVRARGPSLGVAGALADPTLTLVPASGATVTNDDWATAANASTLQARGLAPTHAKEAALLVTLNPGAYTAIVSGVGNTSGVAIVEVLEVDHPEIPMTGISTRGRVRTGDNVMIAGIIIQGTSAQTVVIRARGPSLASQGVSGTLANPVLTLVPASGTTITNDDWGTAANAATLKASGYAPTDARESALLVTLNPGAYTAIVSGAGGTSGVALVEVYAQ